MSCFYARMCILNPKPQTPQYYGEFCQLQSRYIEIPKPYTHDTDKNTMMIGDNVLMGPTTMVWAWYEGDGMAMDGG